ncbi:MAG: SDR family oxidoreductase [Oryzomonas sp.]|jgi:nucleoside-diphosphate-sugar epimerase
MTRDKTETFVLTGATGFLGSHLMASLLEQGHRLVILGRRSDEGSLVARIARLLAWFDLEGRQGQLETAEVDLTKPALGLPQGRYDALCAAAGPIIHCASDTRFSEQNRPESIASNVHALAGMIGFAKDSAAPWFHYISTAYAAGGASPCGREVTVPPGEFLNVYEETKAWAEREVAAQCGEHSIPFTIIRPSIVCGDSRNGRANRFNALYNHVKALYFIREIYLNDIRTQGGRKSRDWGIRLDDNGILHIPLRIVLPQRGTINLIPVDYFVSATLALLDHGQSGTIYHLTTDTPTTVETLASYCEAFLKIKGIEIVYGHPPDALEQNPPEALFNRFIEPYRPYLSDMRDFDRHSTDCGTAGLLPSEFTYPVFERCMKYAVGVNWGR